MRSGEIPFTRVAPSARCASPVGDHSTLGASIPVGAVPLRNVERDRAVVLPAHLATRIRCIRTEWRPVEREVEDGRNRYVGRNATQPAYMRAAAGRCKGPADRGHVLLDATAGIGTTQRVGLALELAQDSGVGEDAQRRR